MREVLLVRGEPAARGHIPGRDTTNRLGGHVIEYWEVEGRLSAFRETLLPNGAVELMINLGPPHRVIGPSASEWWTGAWFSGLHEQAITIESLEGTHHRSGVSRKHLAVGFTRHVGVSLKAYAKVRRVMWTLAQLQASQSVSWSVLAGDAGYSDQSHLARDFRRIGAASPTEYLRRRAPGSPGAEALLYDAD